MKNKNKHPKTYRGKLTRRQVQRNYWKVLIAFTFASLVLMLSMYLSTTVSYTDTVAAVTVPSSPKVSDNIQVLEGTPMENAIPHIRQASDYYGVPTDLYLGIAFAESSFKHYECYNPWGIGNGGPRCYQSWEHSVDGFSQLIKYYYLNEGKITADQLLRKYVGWHNPDWVRNVKTYYNPRVVIE